MEVFVYISSVGKFWWAFVPGFVLEGLPLIQLLWKDYENWINRYFYTKEQRKKIAHWVLLGGFIVANFLAFQQITNENKKIKDDTNTYVKNRDFKNKILEFSRKLEQFEKEAPKRINDPSEEYSVWLNGVIDEIVKTYDWLASQTTSKFADRIFYQVMPNKEVDKDAKLRISERLPIARKDLVGPVLEDLRRDIESKLIIGAEWYNYVSW